MSDKNFIVKNGISIANSSATPMTANQSGIYHTGTIEASIFNSLSDENEKTNITTITDAISIITQLRGVEFYWKDDGDKSSGVIAQELEKVLPHLININEIGTMSVNYSGIIAYLIESIKELNDKIEKLR